MVKRFKIQLSPPDKVFKKPFQLDGEDATYRKMEILMLTGLFKLAADCFDKPTDIFKCLDSSGRMENVVDAEDFVIIDEEDKKFLDEAIKKSKGQRPGGWYEIPELWSQLANPEEIKEQPQVKPEETE